MRLFPSLRCECPIGPFARQLSSATRVQLMLAVRVAFVESQERRVALPLLLDETLGTATTIVRERSSMR